MSRYKIRLTNLVEEEVYYCVQPMMSEVGKDGNMIIPKNLVKFVAFLFVQHGIKWTEIGTAFFLNVTEGETISTYIVTCKHVIKESRKKDPKCIIYLRLNRFNGPGVDYVPINSEWVYHNQKEIDIAVALHIPDASRKLFIGAYEIPNGVLTRKEEQERKFSVPLGFDVAFVGLFPHFKGKERNYPVVRQGRVAMLTDEKIEGWYGESTYYFLEAQAYPGNSGSPVFVPVRFPNSQNTEWLIWGVVHGFYPHEQLIYHDVRNEGKLLYSHFGLSLVTPIDYVLDILNGKVFMEQRKKNVKG